MAKINVKGTSITVYSKDDKDFISLTDMLKAKDGDFFISDWLRNRNTVEVLGIWEQGHNPNFNYSGFATIRSQAGLNNYKLSVKEWVAQTKVIGLVARAGRYGGAYAHNAYFNDRGLAQAERPKLLNQTVIQQITLLLADAGTRRPEGKQP